MPSLAALQLQLVSGAIEAVPKTDDFGKIYDADAVLKINGVAFMWGRQMTRCD